MFPRFLFKLKTKNCTVSSGMAKTKFNKRSALINDIEHGGPERCLI